MKKGIILVVLVVLWLAKEYYAPVSDPGPHTAGVWVMKAVIMGLVVSVMMQWPASWYDLEETAEERKKREKGMEDAAHMLSPLHRAIAYLRKGEYNQAIADSTEAIRLDPSKNPPYVIRGCAYRLKGQYDQAIADCNEAIRLDPKTSFAFFNRGEAHLEKGEYDQAIADSTEAIRLDPSKIPLPYATRGGAYLKKRDFDRAIADCTEAIRLDPKCQCAYERRGEAYLMKGAAADPKNPKAQCAEYDRAIADCTEAIRLKPIGTFAYLTRHMAFVVKGKVAYLSKGESDLAEADLLATLTRGPSRSG